jgi:hypothetical protein
MRKFLALLICLLPSFAFAGLWKVTELENNEANIYFSNQINSQDIDRWKTYVDKYDKINLYIYSEGGAYYAGIKMGYISYENKEKINTNVVMALSAAAYWATGVGIENVTFDKQKNSLIGWHFPFLASPFEGDEHADKIVGVYHQHFTLVMTFYPNKSDEDTQEEVHKKMFDAQTKATQLFLKMVDAYDKHDQDGMVMIDKDGEMKIVDLEYYVPPVKKW